MPSHSQTIRDFFARFTAILRGDVSDPFSLCHPDIVVTVGGNLEMSGDLRGIDAYRAALLAMQSSIAPSPGNGIFIESVLEEGDKALVIARGLIEFANGRIYNNEYAMWMHFRDGLIDRLYEDCDTAIILTGPLSLTLKYE